MPTATIRGDNHGAIIIMTK